MSFENIDSTNDLSSPEGQIPDAASRDKAIDFSMASGSGTEYDDSEVPAGIDHIIETQFALGGMCEVSGFVPDDPGDTYGQNPSEAYKEMYDIPATSGTPDETPGEGRSPEASETGADDPILRIETIQKIDPKASELPPGNVPDSATVAEALLAGEDQVLDVYRPGPGKPFVVRATPGMVPPGATARPITSTGPTDSGDLDPDQVITRYARLRPQRHASSQNAQRRGGPERASDDSASDTLRLQELSKSGGASRLYIAGAHVTPSAHDRIIGLVEEAVGIAEEVNSLNPEVAGRQTVLDDLTEALDSAATRLSVIVGAKDEASLRRLTRTVAGQVLPSKDTTWKAEEASPRTIRVYKSLEEALAAGEDDLRSYTSAERLADLGRLPTDGLHGLEAREPHIFSRNRRVKPGVPTVTDLAMIIDHVDSDGTEHYAGDLPIPFEDINRHVAVLGISGFGKTTLLHRLITRATVSAYQQEQAAIARGEIPTPFAVFMADYAKIGNFRGLVDQLAGARLPDGSPLPERLTTFNLISPGGKGVQAGLNILRPVGNKTPVDQVTFAEKVIAGTVDNDEAKRVLTKWTGAGAVKAFEMLGWNMSTGRSRYPFGTPPIPDGGVLLLGLDGAIKGSRSQEKTTQDIGGFTLSEHERRMRGVIADLCGPDSYDVNMGAVVTSPTGFELGRITDMTAQRFATSVFFNGLTAELQARHPDGDTKKMEHMGVFDEVGNLFGDPETALVFTKVRGFGQGLVYGKQTNYKEIHLDVIGNTTNVFGMRIDGDDQAEIGKKIPATPEQLKFLSMAGKGRGMYYGDEMPDGPVQFAVPNPDNPEETPRGHGTIRGPEAVVYNETDVKFYDVDARREGRDWLLTDRLGQRVRAWAEVNALLVLSGRKPTRISGAFLKELQDMGQKIDDPVRRQAELDKRDSALTLAAAKAIQSRPDCMWVAPWEESFTYIRDSMLGQVWGEPYDKEATARLDLCFDNGYYSQVEDALSNAMATPRLPDSDRLYYEEALGAHNIDFVGDGAKTTVRIGRGTLQPDWDGTAQEEWNSIDRLEKNSYLAIRDALGGKETGAEASKAMNQAAAEFAKIAGSTESAKAQAIITKKITELLGRDMNETEQARFTQLAERVSRQPSQRRIGYPDIREALKDRDVAHKAYIKARGSRIDLSKWEDIYGEKFEGDSIYKQLENVMKKKSLRTQGSSHMKRIKDANIVLPVDLLQGGNQRFSGGSTLDILTQHFTEETIEDGDILRVQRRTHNAGREPMDSLDEILKRGDVKRAEQWPQRLGNVVFYNPDFGLDAASRAHLSGRVLHFLNVMKERSKEENAKGKKA